MRNIAVDLLLYERCAWADGIRTLGGVDEAGRGPLAGPVVAACVCMDPDLIRRRPTLFAGLTDSKQLSATRRDHFFKILTHTPGVTWAVACVEPEEIDRLNILRATHTGMRRAISSISPQPELVLVDGLPVPGLPCPSRSIVKGDRLSLSIAAASVLAKVTRDRIMVAMEEVYPGYGFRQHKGYPTRAHVEALQRLGPCPTHRRSFAPVRNAEARGNTLPLSPP